jgi:hypothetical protein
MGVLVVQSEQPLAVAVDGLALGQAPLSYELAPGAHQVVVSRADSGAVLDDFQVEIAAGKTHRVCLK